MATPSVTRGVRRVGVGALLLVSVGACGRADSGAPAAPLGPPEAPSPTVARLTVRVRDGSVTLGGALRVPVTASNAAGDSVALPGDLTFVSRDPTAVSVDGAGTVTGRTFGTRTWVVALAPAGGRTLADSMRVTVVCPSDLRASVFPARVTLRPGESAALRGRVLGCLGQLELADTLRWQSSDPAVATVDSASGLVTGRAPGAAAVTMTGRRYPAIAGAEISVVP